MKKVEEKENKNLGPVIKPAKLPDEPNLSKKPIWYLFLFANVLVLLGCAITFALMWKTEALSNKNLYLLPTVICDPIAIILAILFIWLEAKDIAPKAMHFQKKWLKFYIIAGAFFIVAILFSVIFYLVCARYDQFVPTVFGAAPKKWVWIIYLSITGVFTLVSIGFQRYARFRIDLDVYRRRHGEIIKQKAEEEKKAKTEQKETEKTKSTKTPKSKITKPSGGLLEQMDN